MRVQELGKSLGSVAIGYLDPFELGSFLSWMMDANIEGYCVRSLLGSRRRRAQGNVLV